MKNFKKIIQITINWILTLSSVEKTDEGKIDFAVGGQAVIEGVMMRSPNSVTIAVRKANKEIKIDKRHYQSIIQKYKFLNIPIVRGVINLFEMMTIGTKAINFSANESLEEEEQIKDAEKKSSPIIDGLMFAISMVLALALSLFLFKFVPLWITTFIDGKAPYVHDNFIVFNLIDGIIKMSIFLSYILILSLIPSFRRIFEYHGAEHKSIFNYESKKELSVENAKVQSRFHPRCGTSFILIVFVISIIVYTFVPKQDNFWMNLLLRLAFLPLIAGIAYEYLKASAKYSKNFFVSLLVAPGLWFQKITTKEPDNAQLEIGLASLGAALEMEEIKN